MCWPSRFLQGLYKDVIRLFAQLPLAALVQGNTLIMHGGLFRAPPERVKGGPKYKNLGALPDEYQLRTGTLQDLQAASKGGPDPDPDGQYPHAEADMILQDARCVCM